MRAEDGRCGGGCVPDRGDDECAVAVVRTSITTMLAFGSLTTAASPGLGSLGWIVAVGVAVCLLTSLLVLPPLWSNRKP